MTILDQIARSELFQPISAVDIFLLHLAQRLQDEQHIGWYVRNAQHSVDSLLDAYRRTLVSPVSERAAQFRSLILNQPAP